MPIFGTLRADRDGDSFVGGLFVHLVLKTPDILGVFADGRTGALQFAGSPV